MTPVKIGAGQFDVDPVLQFPFGGHVSQGLRLINEHWYNNNIVGHNNLSEGESEERKRTTVAVLGCTPDFGTPVTEIMQALVYFGWKRWDLAHYTLVKSLHDGYLDKDNKGKPDWIAGWLDKLVHRSPELRIGPTPPWCSV